MKFNKFFLAVIASVSLFALAVGCQSTSSTNPPPQRIAYNTISTIEQTASAAVDGYYTSVIKGIASTNHLPEVSRAFNQLQAACALAAVTSQNGTNALAPAELTQELAQLTSLISSFTTTNK